MGALASFFVCESMFCVNMLRVMCSIVFCV